jgi:hypothetical protein
VTSSANISPSKIKIRIGVLALIGLVAFGASGCGRRGNLEPAPDPNAVVKPDNDPTHPQIHHKPKPVEPPKVPFVLDPLL